MSVLEIESLTGIGTIFKGRTGKRQDEFAVRVCPMDIRIVSDPTSADAAAVAMNDAVVLLFEAPLRIGGGCFDSRQEDAAGPGG